MVIVTEDLYNYEVSWELTCDGLSAPITGGSPYEEMHAVLPGSCSLVLMDSYGDGWQGATWTAPGWTDRSFDCLGDRQNVSFVVGFQPPSPPVPPSSPPPRPSPPAPPPMPPLAPLVRSDISVTDDTYNWEVSWELTCDGLSAPITGGSPYSATHAVLPGSCVLVLMDSYGDGWQGAAWSAPGWTNQSFTLTDGFDETVSFHVGDQPPQPAPPPPPPATPPQPPFLPAHWSEISVSDDRYKQEVAWELTCDGLSAPITGGAPYSATHGASPGSCTLSLSDSWGDGWQDALT